MFSLSVQETVWGDLESPLRDPVHTRAELDRLQNMISSLKPEILVFRTPLSLRPGSAALDRWLKLCVDRLQKMATAIVWEPTGIWEREAAVHAVRELENVLVVADPLHDDVSGESHVYARMRGMGVDSRYHAGKLEDLLSAIEHCDEAWVVFETPSGFKEATGLLALHKNAGVPAFSSEDETDADEQDEDELDEDELDEDEDEDFEDEEDLDEPEDE